VFVGQALLLAFGITIPSSRIAGGPLILFAALKSAAKNPPIFRPPR
jgi:small neutral amino acid transporter SnatA (MarC family)